MGALLKLCNCSPQSMFHPSKNLEKLKNVKDKGQIQRTYRVLTCFYQFLSPFWPPFMHSICPFVFLLKWKERIFPCCLARYGRKGVRGGLQRDTFLKFNFLFIQKFSNIN